MRLLILTGVVLVAAAVGAVFAFPQLSGSFDRFGMFGSPGDWPPQLNATFPEIEFTNYDGRKIHLSDFKGKVVLVEPVGMNCPACNAFSGGHKKGGFRGLRPQRGLKSIEEYLETRLGKQVAFHDDLVMVQILLYNYSMGAMTIEDAKIWAEHFGFDQRRNFYVLFSETDLRGKASFRMIPGFQLLDRESILRIDSTGDRPRHNLFSDLLPMIARLLRV